MLRGELRRGGWVGGREAVSRWSGRRRSDEALVRDEIESTLDVTYGSNTHLQDEGVSFVNVLPMSALMA